MHDTKIEMKLEEETKHLKEICEKLEKAAHMELEKGIENVNVEEMGQVVDMIKDLSEAKEKVIKACYYKKILSAMEEADKEEEEAEKYMLRTMKEQYGDDEESVRRGYDSWRYSDGRFAPKGRGSYRPRSSGRRGYDAMMPWDMSPDMDMYGVSDMDRAEIGRRMGRNVHYYGGGSGSGSSVANNGGSMGGNSGSSNGSGRGYDDGMEEGRRRGYEEGKRDGERNARMNESRYEQRKRGYEEAKHSTADSKEKAKKMGEVVDSFIEDAMELIEGASPEERTVLKSKLSTAVSRI